MVGLLKCEATPRQRRLLNELEDFRYRRRGTMILRNGGIYVLLNSRATGKRTKARYGVILLTAFDVPDTVENSMRWVKRELRSCRRQAKRDAAREAIRLTGAYI